MWAVLNFVKEGRHTGAVCDFKTNGMRWLGVICAHRVTRPTTLRFGPVGAHFFPFGAVVEHGLHFNPSWHNSRSCKQLPALFPCGNVVSEWL